MAELIVAPIMEKLIEKLIDTCYKYLQDQFRWQTDMKEELKRLQENHSKIQAVVSDARQAQMIDLYSPLTKWIWQLRDAIDEADDVPDDFEYMKHEEQLAINIKRTNKQCCMSWVKKIGKRPFNSDPMLKRLEEVVHRLDKISAEIMTFHNLLKEKKQEQQAHHDELQNCRETGSMPTDVLIGRSQDLKFVIQWLGKLPNEEHQSHVSNIPNYNNISVLSIVAPGGMGKTTLLQHVYEDNCTNDFNLKMWVCVSNHFDFKKVLIDMLESLQNSTPSEIPSLDTLQKNLRSKVMAKKFLLVLDDIWEEDEEQDKRKWEKVLAPLAYGGLGSKILLTTRMSSIALMIENIIKKKSEVLKLEGLEELECLKLFNIYAFVDVENQNEHNKLRFIARKLVKKLHGSPLAAKVLGGALNSNLDETHWRDVLNNVLNHKGISSILELTYIFLPKHLQNCFAFCSIFKQDHIFDKDDLIRMWIAVGFIQPSYIGEEILEDIGKSYFDILVKKSFFDKHGESEYKMHYLLHELAKKVSSQDCFRIMDDKDLERIPETIRHLSITTDNLILLKKMRRFKNLRTLFITFDSDNQKLVDVLTKIFEESRSIRLLSIHAYYQKMIPEKIECLKHLRYLYLCFSCNTLLPRSVSNLYHLQFLICQNCGWHDDFFPRDMNNLSNLRCLRTPHFKFSGIGKLKFLQELNGFEVKNESGYRIEELKHMNDLRILGIEGLENVRDVEEACNAKLCDKRKLMDLSLEWGHDSEDRLICARVLDNLQPPNNLKKLSMKGYIGVRSAIWMNNANLINNLEDIDLFGCLEWQILPPFGKLPFLKSLRLCIIPKAERFGNIFHGNDLCGDFPSLEVLHINKLEALEDWFDARVDCLFPCLSELWLYSCPNLQELPYLPHKLKELKANNIGWKILNCCSILGPSGRFLVRGCPNISTIKMNWEITGGPGVLNNVELEDFPNLLSIGGHQEVDTTENCLNLIVVELNISDASVLQMEPMRSITSVRELTIGDHDGPASLPFEAERWFLQVSSSLCELYFINLRTLQSLPSYLTSLSSLEILRLENILLLESLPDLPPSLRELKLDDLENLNSLPSCLPILSSLTSLAILKVPKLRELPNLPVSLCKLTIENLDNLNCLPSCLPSLSSLTELHIWKAPQLRELPDLPPSLCSLKLRILDNLNSLPSCLPSLSSLTSLGILKVPELRELPDLPASLCTLGLENLDNLNSLPSCLPSISSLTDLTIRRVPQLREFPDLPASLCSLKVENLDNLNCLPSCLPSLSSLTWLAILKVPELRQLPDLPVSLCTLMLKYLENLNNLPSCLPSLSSLTKLDINKVPKLRELPDLPPSLRKLRLDDLDNLNCLPSCLPSLSSFRFIYIRKVPQLRELPVLPPSLHDLKLDDLENLNSLPSCLHSLSSLTELIINKIPRLRDLPDFPASLCTLTLRDLDNLNNLPSFLPTLSSLTILTIRRVPRLRQLPDLPPSLKRLIITECDPELIKRYKELSIFWY